MNTSPLSLQRVFVYGDRSIGSGGWCYSQALQRRGISVDSFSDWDGLEDYHRRTYRRVFRRVTSSLFERDRSAHVSRLVARINHHRSQLVVVLKGLHLGPQDVHRLRDSGCTIINVNHDDFFSRYSLNWSILQRAAIPLYDYVLTTREVNVEEVRPLNPHVSFFPFAYEPLIHKPIDIPRAESEIWSVDAVFVGTYAHQRACLLEKLVQLHPARYAVWGNGWHRLSRGSPLRKYVHFKALDFEDQSKAICGAKLAFGFLRKENRDDYTQRTFEIPACGGLLLAERTERHMKLYKEGIEAEFFNPERPDELVQKTRRLLSDPARSSQIRVAGQRAVARSGHTYDARIDQLFSVYERLGLPNANVPGLVSLK